jgi:hypothetical protein
MHIAFCTKTDSIAMMMMRGNDRHQQHYCSQRVQ